MQTSININSGENWTRIGNGSRPVRTVPKKIEPVGSIASILLIIVWERKKTKQIKKCKTW